MYCSIQHDRTPDMRRSARKFLIFKILTGFSSQYRYRQYRYSRCRLLQLYASAQSAKDVFFYHQILQTSRLDRRASRLSKTRRKSRRHSKNAGFGVMALKIKPLDCADPCRKLTIVF
jgi:hypothetical protein